MKTKYIIISALMLLAATVAQAQVAEDKPVINIKGKVFGGARQADVDGNTYITIAAKNFDVIIDEVFGGNDISGEIGTNDTKKIVPPELINARVPGISNTSKFDAYISTDVEATGKHLFIGQLFGGGNGDYHYVKDEDTDTYKAYKDAASVSTSDPLATGIKLNGNGTTYKPELSKVYLSLKGGTFGYVYGGGNAATVTERTEIYIDNDSEITKKDGTEDDNDHHNIGFDPLTADRLKEVLKLPADATFPEHYNDNYQFSRVFGGNNKAAMDISATWHLNKGSIENLFSGGNAGDMTCEKTNSGEISLEVNGADMTVFNVYGGCRKADVYGKATVTISGGNINYVYGGNDISGTVYGGTNVNIFSSIIDDVYGGSNGSYVYTDKVTSSDYYYAPGTNTLDALNAHRPNVTSTNIFLRGTSDEKPVCIGGSVYCGGNSATLRSATRANPTATLKIGSYVWARNVFLGNNGVNMTTDETLNKYNNSSWSTIGSGSSPLLITPANMAKYMEGVEMGIKSTVTFDAAYVDSTAHFGSFYCGGNVGSIKVSGTNEFHFDKTVFIHEKLVGGCNSAYVAAKDKRNAAFNGGMLKTAEESESELTKVRLNLSGLRLEPRNLEFNPDTKKYDFHEYSWEETVDNSTVTKTSDWYLSYGDGDPVTEDGRLRWGNVYGGCYTSGVIEGNVEINIETRTVNYAKVFATLANDGSGVDRYTQSQDVFCKALSVFGGGYGEQSVIEGDTKINVKNNGVVFQVFGGGEKGPVNGNTEVNLIGGTVNEIYGGGFEGVVNGHTQVNLNNGWFYDSFGGACNANVRDYTETYIGKPGFPAGATGGTLRGYNVYGANDFGGQVGVTDAVGYTSQTHSGYEYVIDEKDVTETYPLRSAKPKDIDFDSYVEYYHGKVDSIAGGNYGNYEYETHYNRKKDPDDDDDLGGVAAQLIAQGARPAGYEFKKPKVGSSFLNIQTPQISANDRVLYFLGGSEGASDEADNDEMQSNSYVLVEAPGLNMPEDLANNYHGANVYGAGAHAGLKGGTTQVWLLKGHVKNVFGASLNEGCTENAHVYVPVGSTIHANAIFGGADGELTDEYRERMYDKLDDESDEERDARWNALDEDDRYWVNMIPCDATNAYVEFASDQAIIDDAIYGGNNFQRRTQYATVNISVPVKNQAANLCDVYGAGYGEYSWADCTKVNLLDGAQVQDLYGGGRDGKVFENHSEHERMMEHHPGSEFANNHEDPIQKVKYNELNKVHSEDEWEAGTYNTNVKIYRGATVEGNAFAGGKGSNAIVSGQTGLTLAGGTVVGNIYGGGEEATVRDRYKLGNSVFKPTTNVLLLGGRVTEVYGGGLDGDVGRGDVANKDVSGFTNITIGKLHQADPTFYNGDPTVERSLYGGGYRGKVYGTASTTMNNGHIGYKYNTTSGEYEQNLNYDNDTNNHLKQNGNLFGAGYGEGATVDHTVVTMYDGVIRNSLYGGGEISAVGRGVDEETYEFLVDPVAGTKETGFHPGSTLVTMYGGTVEHSVFGGGRGYAIDAYGGTKSGEVGYSDGYTFGSTDVRIHGGVIGTEEAVDEGDGNVFGGGNIGFVYAGVGVKSTTDGYGYYRDGNGDKTRDCCVIISPYCRVKSTAQESMYKLNKDITKEVTENGETTTQTLYPKDKLITAAQLAALKADTEIIGFSESDYETVTKVIINNEPFDVEGPNSYVSTDKLNQISGNSADWKKLDDTGIKIGNAVFAGGNVSAGSDKIYANTKTVFGNAVASVTDVFAKDFITIGEDGIGGLYGDGNLTFVDGYRGLNITNYGTDYYNLSTTVEYEQYLTLSDRERAYFELEYETANTHKYSYYECKHTHTYVKPNGEKVQYKHGQKIALPENVDTDTDLTHLALIYNRDGAIETSATITDAMKTKGYWWKFGSTDYTAGKPIKEDEYNLMDEDEKELWVRKGFCRLYAGRLINTIQRADFCGVFGSRVVMRGAQDRVTNSADYTEYTINRVGEVSLNKVVDPNDPTDKTLLHGNYFGIYNVVNYLGALTSDVPFVPSGTSLPTNMLSDDAVRTTDNSNAGYTTNGDTFYEWKQDNLNNRKRNDGICHNDVALASGVWLEIVKEPAAGSESTEKEYGPITGVVELALINVATGEGGGYVYAKNQHGVLDYIEASGQLLLSDANKNAVTYKQFHYKDPQDVVSAEAENRELLITDANGKEPGEDGYINTYGVLTTDQNGKNPGETGYIKTFLKKNGEFVIGHPITPKMQTSGNFINSDKRIVDDCYPLSGAYMGADASPAHYWYIRGDFYVYDQYISAYTGSAQAYAEKITIPLTITAEAQGRLLLNSVNQNLYAYWTGDLKTNTDVPDQFKSKVDDNAIVAGNLSYHKNDPITYWDWSRLTAAEKELFTEITYNCTTPVTYGNVTYAKGDAILPSDYNALPTNQYVVIEDFEETNSSTGVITTYTKGQILTSEAYNSLQSKEDKEKCITIKDCFNVSNSISHDSGFLLTLDWDNPEKWNKYYRKPNDDQNEPGKRVDSNFYNGLTEEQQKAYTTSPTFRCKTTNVYGQVDYKVGAIIDDDIYKSQGQISDDLSTNNISDPRTATPATFAVAYVAKADCKTSDGASYVKGACISATEYERYVSLENNDDALFEKGYLCTESYLPDGAEEHLYGTVIPKSVYDTFTEAVQKKHFKAAYICTREGAWGGSLYIGGNNYSAIKYSNLDADERKFFDYNYDAFDLLSEYFIPGNKKDADDNVYPLDWYEGSSHTIPNTTDQRVIKTGETQIPYAQEQLIDYIATYTGSSMTGLGTDVLHETVTVTPDNSTSTVSRNYLLAGDKLTNEEYESLINEQFKYTPIIVSGDDDNDKIYYVVKQSFGMGETWYAPGNQVSEAVYENLSPAEQERCIERVYRNTLPDLPTGTSTKRYYFCTRQYTAVTPITDARNTSVSYAAGSTVPVGTIINEVKVGSNNGYNNLINEQTDFSIDGKIPNTTSTLYVSREVDIDKLQQDKVVTVTYWYEYVESDADARSYEIIRERHVINVHIHFESGVPTIGTLLPPSTVLPGEMVGLNQPSVSKGAFEVLGGGWEIYSKEEDATLHQNGSEYESGKTPMYWYQDGYWIAYYAKTYLGRTYSNPVKFSVANYHRMGDVMSSTHKETIDDGASGTTEVDVHDYMYLNKALEAGKADAKVYIGSSEELDNFKSFYDLTAASGAATDKNFSEITDCQGLNFFLDNEIEHTGAWTSVGDEGHCFSGNFHGDGHAITGLQNSLFNWLCGDVYNTGVAGSFTGAGIAENGDGYVQNCWIKTTGTPTTGAGHYPVFGNPVRDAAAIAVHGVVQVENCYYPESNDYYVTYPDGYSRGKAIQKPDAAFINGEVAYNLNSFYLAQRYSDNSGKGTAGNAYWKLEDAGVDGKTPTSVKYPAENPEDINRYVESRYDNVDFLYADGIVPDVGAVNIRYNATNGKYYPIYPDDYIFFGQNLTYGLVTGGGAHDEHPTAVLKYKATEENKNSNHLLIPGKTGTRVYRAPGYYRSSDMEQVFFNPDAAFKDKYTPRADGIFGSSAQTIDIHNRLTAIDFTGYHDRGAWSDGSSQDNYFRHVLDYNGLSSFTTSGVTRNLLVYADVLNDAASHEVLQHALQDYEPYFSDFYDNTQGYKKVRGDLVDDSNVKGHLVSKNSNAEYVSSSDQLLVDKQDFNAPISYRFENPLGEKRMWYLRMPDNYVGELKNSDGTYNRQAGWEGISIPFKAELVTTNDKGEITHFYSGSEESKNDTHTKIGHEYWLRHYTDLSAEADANGVRTATMRYPDADTNADDKVVTNTFLWDYYYNETVSPHHEDQNNDTYQTYYNSTRTYSKYPRLTNGTPYIIGFPGERYYEFDLSGKFSAETTANPDPTPLKAQTISFVSKPGVVIGVSDDEMVDAPAKEVTEGNTKTTFTFKPSYLNETLTNTGKLQDGTTVYTLKADGSEYELASNTGATSPVAFRPYFTMTSATSARPVTRSIVFSNDDSQLKGVEEKGDPNSEDPGRLSIYAKKHKIIVESALTRDVDIRIVNAAGITVTTFNIEPGETVETRINNAGVYIVQSADGRYTKKLAVR